VALAGPFAPRACTIVLHWHVGPGTSRSAPSLCITRVHRFYHCLARGPLVPGLPSSCRRPGRRLNHYDRSCGRIRRQTLSSRVAMAASPGTFLDSTSTATLVGPLRQPNPNLCRSSFLAWEQLRRTGRRNPRAMGRLLGAPDVPREYKAIPEPGLLSHRPYACPLVL
jgi:hypothetical protein